MLILLGFLAMPIVAIWQGLVLKILWGWFMVPTFGLPSLDIPQALGLALVVTFLTHQTTKREDEDAGEVFARILINGFVEGLFFLGFGAIVMLFMQ